jgi:hypothetical protein
LGKVMSDLGGAYSAVLVYVGDKLGLYRAMAKSHEGGGAGSMTMDFCPVWLVLRLLDLDNGDIIGSIRMEFLLMLI